MLIGLGMPILIIPDEATNFAVSDNNCVLTACMVVDLSFGDYLVSILLRKNILCY